MADLAHQRIDPILAQRRLIIAACLLWFSMFTYVALLTPYVKSLDATHVQAGWIVGSFGFMQIVLRMPVGLLSDRLGRRKLFIQLSFGFALLSAIGLLFSRNLAIILLARTMAGIAAANWVHYNVLFPNYFAADKSVKAVGILNAAAMVAQTLAMLAGGLLADHLSMQAVFAASALTALLGLIIAASIYEQRPIQAPTVPFSTAIKVVGNPRLLVVAAFAALVQLLTYAVTFGFITVHARIRFAASGSAIALLSMTATIFGAFSSLIGNTRLVRRANEPLLALCGIMVFAVATMAIPLMPTLSSLIMLQAMAGLGRGVAFTMAMALVIQSVPANRRATAMGFYQASYGIGTTAGPVMMGKLADTWGLGPGFVVIGLASLLLALALIPFYRYSHLRDGSSSISEKMINPPTTSD